MFVFLHRYLVVDALMAATVVVILDVVPNALSQARHVVLRVDIDTLRLNGTPEALYPDVVLAASTATEQIGHPVLRLTKSGQAFPRVYRGDAHLAHQPADTFGTDKEAQQEQVIHHALNALGGMLRVLPVYLPHHLKALRGLTLGLVVVCTLADAKKLQLAVHAQPAARGY